MKPTRLLLALPLILALMLALSAACGGDDAPTDEEYFRRMDEVDKEVDARFDPLCEGEDANAKTCATDFGNALATTETQYEDVSAAEDAKDEHEELVAAIKESRENIEGAADEFSEEDPPDAIFESDAFDFTRVDAAFCAIQDLADEKGIEADVGCGVADGEAVDPATLPAEATTEISIQDFAFDPPHIEVQVGDTVTWTQGADPEPHNAVADDDSFRAPPEGVLEEEGATAESTFDEAGEFPYFCEVHPEMRGQVTVTE
jgi:plastocyanin